ncbi:hypothetical protein B0H13DRAFT_1892671 [Mycena leptocephala]|nr:hypothetical protein B0H13DRAFT_1892671 [Mycena leptocephala]
MQYIVDPEQFDGDWDVMMELFLQMGVSLLLYVISCIMAVLGTAQMTFTIAQSVLKARFVQQVVHSQLLKEDKALSEFSVLSLRTIRDFTLVINRLIWTLVVSLLCDMGIPKEDTPRACAAHTIYLRLESGAIYCITAIFLVITASLYDEEIFAIGLSIAQQLINIIPTFTLVYVGLNNTDYSQPKEHVRQVPSTSRLAVVRPYQPCEVLDIKPQSAEEKDGECV